MKFSVKSVYPFSTSLRPANYPACRKLAALGVEYLFMGNGNPNQWQLPHSNHDIKYASISVLRTAEKLDQRSGRYRHK